MKILHITPSVGPLSYGLGQVALNLMKAQTEIGHDSVIWSLDEAVDGLRAAESIGVPADRIRTFPSIGPRSLGFSPSLIRAARIDGNGVNVVHQHGIWTAISYVTTRLRTWHGLRSVVAPHGSLDSAVIRKSLWKKRLALAGYEAANLAEADCLQATAPAEIEDFRSYGLQRPIALIRNGIANKWIQQGGDAERFRASCGIPADRRVMLFMSRIAPKKGLPMLLKAWSRQRLLTSSWLLLVVGGDEDGHRVEVENLRRELGLTDQVRFVGPKFGQDKRDAFAAAEVLVLPSISEGFPIVVLDALGAGVPAIVTKATAWKDLESYDCGWWVDASVAGLEGALAAALTMPKERLKAMGAAGRRLVSTNYNWTTIATTTIELYEWLLRSRKQPAFVSVS
jgi:glycosyltransferase involved in cell wall biosynthesis